MSFNCFVFIFGGISLVFICSSSVVCTVPDRVALFLPGKDFNVCLFRVLFIFSYIAFWTCLYSLFCKSGSVVIYLVFAFGSFIMSSDESLDYSWCECLKGSIKYSRWLCGFCFSFWILFLWTFFTIGYICFIPFFGVEWSYTLSNTAVFVGYPSVTDSVLMCLMLPCSYFIWCLPSTLYVFDEVLRCLWTTP